MDLIVASAAFGGVVVAVGIVVARIHNNCGTAQLGLSGLEYHSSDNLDLKQLEEALEVLAELAPRARRQLRVAIGACISADREVSESEAHLVRGICDALDYPMPALLPGQPIAPGA